jgi:hypothetical protein
MSHAFLALAISVVATAAGLIGVGRTRAAAVVAVALLAVAGVALHLVSLLLT